MLLFNEGRYLWCFPLDIAETKANQVVEFG